MSEQQIVICGGRFGDLLLLTPAFCLMAKRTGKPVKVVVSQQFASVLEGTSAVEPITTGMDWIAGIPEAKKDYPTALIPQFWLDQSAPEYNLSRTMRHPSKSMSINGRSFTYSPAEDNSYDIAMWRRLGFTKAQMLATPLVLDRRSSEREAEVAAPYARSNKPLLLVNLRSPSSPFTFLPEVVNELLKLAPRFWLVDLSQLRCHRLYDMLGLYDRAAGLVTCDTSTFHLAPASKLPYAAFTADGWRGSTPRGNCVWSCPYAESMDRLTELIYVVSSWAETPAPQALAHA